MKYRLRLERPSRMVLLLSMPERVFIIVFLSVVSLVGVIGGLAYALSPQDPDDLFRAICFGGVGLFCLSAIILVASSRTHASRLVFDNGTGWLSVVGPRGDSTAAIPYSGISGFSVCRRVGGRMVGHSAGMDLAHGGRWELYTSANERRAVMYRDSLAAAVTLDATVQQRPTPGRELTLERLTGNRVRYSWTRKTRPVPLAISLLVLVSFDVALVGIRPYASGPAAYAVAFGFGAAFLVAAVVSVLRTLGQRVSVEIDRSTISVESSAALVRPARFTIPISQVARVDLSMTFSSTTTRIVLLRAEEVEQFIRYRQGTFSPSETFSLVTSLRGLLRIDVTALPPVHRITLAEALREAVAHDPDPIW
jgi:hypothetical protein